MRQPTALFLTLICLAAKPAAAQLRATKLLTADGMKNIVAAAEAEMKKNNFNMSIAIVDAAGELVFFQKGDGTRPSNADFATRKARTAARYGRETRLLDSALTAGRLAYLATDAFPLEGGVPIIVDGLVIGAVGVSGGTSAQDAAVAKAGIAALITK